jgi:hypothetical protein
LEEDNIEEKGSGTKDLEKKRISLFSVSSSSIENLPQKYLRSK